MTPQEIQEYIKCAKDPIYFLNNYGYVYDIRKSRVDKLSCFNYQENALKNYIKYQNNIVLKSRQTGMSVITAGIVVWMLLFKMDQRILIVANDGAGAVRFLGTVKQYFQFLPKFLFDPDTQAEKDNEKFFSIKNPEGKISWVKAVASSKNAGRGESLTMLILDETAFIENAEDIWMAAGLALSATQGKCIMISCVPKETFVFTDKGLKQIKNFIKEEEKEGYLVDDYLVLGKDKLRTGNLFFNNGFQKTKKIFGTNSFLEGTLTHKIWGYKNGKFDWYKLEELDTEDYFSIQYGNEIFGNNDFIKDFKPSINGKIKNIFNPTIITKEIAYLIGLYIAEGSVYKKYKEEKFIGGIVTITCGDDISNSILNAGLNFSNSDGIHYCIGSKNFIEFLEYLGFDLTKKAKQKEIPSRVLEMSKENIISMLRGMFDGDGCSRKDKGYISYTSSSKTLAEQVRMLLLNFGILTDFQTTETKPTKKVKVKSIRHCIESNAEYSKVFYDKIGFNLKRKQDNEIILEKYNLLRNNPNDIIPDGLKLVEKIIIESKVELKELKKEITQIYSFINSKREYKTNNLSRKIVLKIYDICKKYLSSKTINELDRILCNNLKWNKINKIEFSEKETFDFSLPENDDDFWCHSVIYNGILGHQTPQGTGNLYHKTWIATKKGESDFVPFQIHWTEHPVYSLEKEQRTDDYGRTYWTSPWYEKECERLQYDRVKIAQELDLSFEGSRQLVIESGIIEKYKRSIINEKPELFYDYTKPKERFISTKTNFWVWKKPEHGKNYLVGSDVARGDSKDFSTIQIFDADTCEQVAEYQGKIPPDVFGSLIDRVGRDYNNAYLVVECNSFGLATTLNIKNALKYPEDRIYHSKSIKDIINPSAKVRIKENDDIPGIQTTQVTRPLIISSLNSYMREGKIKINSVRLLEEFDTFIYNGNKPEHADGFNDDLIFALGVLLFVRDTEYFKNFASRDLYKAMIESISNQRTGIGEKINLDAKSTEGVILTSRNTKADDDNDISWLISS